MAFTSKYYITVETNKVLPASAISDANPFRMLQTVRNMLGDIGARNATLAVYDSGDGTQASGTVTFTGTLSHGAGSSNAAFTFTAGSSGACTVTVGSHTGLTVTGSGTAATDATALAAVIATALGADFTVTANAGDVRIVAVNKGSYNFTTTVTATGGAKLSAAGAALTGGNTGSLGNIVVGGHSVSLGSIASSATVGQTMAVIAAQIDAALAASTAVQAIASTSTAVASGNSVSTITALVEPPVAELGNGITLTASVGTASGATLSGGVNATANEHTY